MAPIFMVLGVVLSVVVAVLLVDTIVYIGKSAVSSRKHFQDATLRTRVRHLLSNLLSSNTSQVYRLGLRVRVDFVLDETLLGPALDVLQTRNPVLRAGEEPLTRFIVVDPFPEPMTLVVGRKTTCTDEIKIFRAICHAKERDVHKAPLARVGIILPALPGWNTSGDDDDAERDSQLIMSLDSRLGTWDTLADLVQQLLVIYNFLREQRTEARSIHFRDVIDHESIRSLDRILPPIVATQPNYPILARPLVWAYLRWAGRRHIDRQRPSRPSVPLELRVPHDSFVEDAWEDREPLSDDEIVVCRQVDVDLSRRIEDHAKRRGTSVASLIYCAFSIVLSDLLAERPSTPMSPDTPYTPTSPRPSTPTFQRPSTPTFQRPSTPTFQRPSTPTSLRPTTPIPFGDPHNGPRVAGGPLSPRSALGLTPRLSQGDPAEEFWRMVREHDTHIEQRTDAVLNHVAWGLYQPSGTSGSSVVGIHPWTWPRIPVHSSTKKALDMPAGLSFACSHMDPRPPPFLPGVGDSCRYFVHMNADRPVRLVAQSVLVQGSLHINVPVAGVYTSRGDIERLLDVVEDTLDIAAGGIGSLRRQSIVESPRTTPIPTLGGSPPHGRYEIVNDVPILDKIERRPKKEPEPKQAAKILLKHKSKVEPRFKPAEAKPGLHGFRSASFEEPASHVSPDFVFMIPDPPTQSKMRFSKSFSTPNTLVSQRRK